jgi:hypothetical protein
VQQGVAAVHGIKPALREVPRHHIRHLKRHIVPLLLLLL